jgi:hypothetical protein
VGTTLPPPGADEDDRHRLDWGLLAIMLLGSTFVGIVAGVVGWLASRNPWAAALTGGGGFLSVTTLAVMIRREMR